ncbi:hypothetical protein B0H12DRAFT_1152681 [Mycena haematopus]|nr:hypothetical protein B0H12DRAFT_1152681 [Mycena haematopus]
MKAEANSCAPCSPTRSPVPRVPYSTRLPPRASELVGSTSYTRHADGRGHGDGLFRTRLRVGSQ